MSKEIVDNLIDKKYEDLNKVVYETLLTKAVERLDNFKTEIASNYFSSVEHIEEETEQLDELSKKTLVNYIKLATSSAAHVGKWYNHKDTPQWKKEANKKINNREKGVERAANKLAKEETEQLDELSKKTLGLYVNKAADDAETQSRKWVVGGTKQEKDNQYKKINKKIDNRFAGMDLAVKKLKKEETEQLDELSKKTLSAYADKAISRTKFHRDRMHGKEDQAISWQQAGAHELARKKWDEAGQHKKTFNKRFAGAKLAVKKLAKEE